MLRDLHNNIVLTLGNAPKAAVTDNTAQVSAVLDNVNGGAVEFVGILGTNADSDMTYTVLVEDSPDNSSFTAVDDAYLLGVEAMSLDFADDNAVFKIGYIGPQRYVRVTLTPAANTGNVFFAGVWIQSGMRVKPNSTQVT